MSILFLVPLFILGCGEKQSKNEIIYPESRKGDFVENYHGTIVSDPYQ